MQSLKYKCCFLTTAFQIGRLICLPFDYSDSIKCRVLVSKLPRLALCYMATVVIKWKKDMADVLKGTIDALTWVLKVHSLQ